MKDQVDTQDKTGLFLVSYKVTTPAIGSPELILKLTVNTPDRRLSGSGHISSASTNPPLDVRSDVRGSYGEIIFGANTQIAITATGYPPFHMPPGGGIGPVILPNLELHMLMESWESGNATYRYRPTFDGDWVDIPDATVTAL